jgi:hypothetical protein
LPSKITDFQPVEKDICILCESDLETFRLHEVFFLIPFWAHFAFTKAEKGFSLEPDAHISSFLFGRFKFFALFCIG